MAIFPLYYPPANRTAQWFQDTEHDAAFTGGLEKVVWHTTEGSGWPGYAGGAKAPHWTVLPDMSARTVAWRQHFPANVYSRALKNEPGGVQTNLDNCLQVEIVGTCDPVAHRAHPSWLFTPQAPGWFLAELADFARFALGNWAIPLTAPTFHAFPGSAGATNKHRFSGPTWNAFRGHCGHQHVPENDHGDPGALPMDRVLTLAQETDMALTTTEIDAIAVAAATETWTRFSIHTPEGDLASLQETLGRTLRASETPPPVDAQALAAALAPLLAPLVPSLTDEDLDRVAAVVADEQARRLAS
jgi:hypothetical protein